MGGGIASFVLCRNLVSYHLSYLWAHILRELKIATHLPSDITSTSVLHRRLHSFSTNAFFLVATHHVKQLNMHMYNVISFSGSTPTSVEFVRHDNNQAVASYSNGKILLFDLETGKELTCLSGDSGSERAFYNTEQRVFTTASELPFQLLIAEVTLLHFNLLFDSDLTGQQMLYSNTIFKLNFLYLALVVA